MEMGRKAAQMQREKKRKKKKEEAEQTTYQILRQIYQRFLALRDLKRPHQHLDPLREPRMTISRDIGLEIHLVPAGIHPSKRVDIVFVVAKPRVARQLGEEHETAGPAILRAAVALFPVGEASAADAAAAVVRAEDVREVLVLGIFGVVFDLDRRSCVSFWF